MAAMREELVERFGNDLAERNSASVVTSNMLEKNWGAVAAADTVGDGEAIKPALTKIFGLLDTNGDGTISESEGVAAGRALFGNGHKGQNWCDAAATRTRAARRPLQLPPARCSLLDTSTAGAGGTRCSRMLTTIWTGRYVLFRWPLFTWSAVSRGPIVLLSSLPKASSRALTLSGAPK